MFSQNTRHRWSKQRKYANGEVRRKQSLLLNKKWWIVFVFLWFLMLTREASTKPKLSLPTQKPFVLFCIVSDMENIFSSWCYFMIHATFETSDENAPTVNYEESHHMYRHWKGYQSWIDSTGSKSKHQACKRSNCKRRKLFCDQLTEPHGDFFSAWVFNIFQNNRRKRSHGKLREKQSHLQKTGRPPFFASFRWLKEHLAEMHALQPTRRPLLRSASKTARIIPNDVLMSATFDRRDR